MRLYCAKGANCEIEKDSALMKRNKKQNNNNNNNDINKKKQKEEIEEECGYDVALESIEKITSFHTSVGFAGSKQMLYYAQVDESMKVSEGGGVDSEMIEVVYLPLKEAKALIYDENIAKTPGLMFAFMWWFEHHKNA